MRWTRVGHAFRPLSMCLVGVIGHAYRAAPLRDYCLGLVIPGERKSVEPVAAIAAPSRVAAKHRKHPVGAGPELAGMGQAG